MYNLKLVNNDLVYEDNELQYAFDGVEKAQQIERTITTKLGEWFLNTQIGLDWDVVFSKPYLAEQVENEIRSTILQVDEIDNVSIDLELEGRLLKVSFSADYRQETIEGVTSIG